MGELHKALKAGGLRKVFTALFMFSCLCVLLWDKSLDPTDFTSLCKILVMSQYAGNAAEHFAPAKPTDPAPGA